MTYMEKIDSYGVDLDFIEETSPFELIGTQNRKPLSHWWSNIDLVVSGKLPVIHKIVLVEKFYHCRHREIYFKIVLRKVKLKMILVLFVVIPTTTKNFLKFLLRNARRFFFQFFLQEIFLQKKFTQK